MLERFRTIIFAAGVLFFAVPFVFLLLPPVWQMASERPPAGVTLHPYSVEELRGRKIYLREGCWYCHSQYVRPVDFEEARYGPVSESWEHLYDLPQLYGTRRIGPDLAREGGKRSDDWHYAHLFHPQSVVKDSVMPSFPWFFWKDASHPSEEGKDLVAYLQALGRGKKVTESAPAVAGEIVVTERSLALGKQAYANYCVSCHGEKGDGNGPAAAALTPRPRNFLADPFKYGETAEAVYKVITEGISGTSMPSFRTVSEEERKGLAAYVIGLRKKK